MFVFKLDIIVCYIVRLGCTSQGEQTGNINNGMQCNISLYRVILFIRHWDGGCCGHDLRVNEVSKGLNVLLLLRLGANYFWVRINSNGYNKADGLKK